RPSGAPEDALRVARDHELLVGRNHPGTHMAVRRADPGATGNISLSVQRDPKPSRVVADTLANRRRILTDASCKHERVEPAERSGKGPQLTPDAIHVDVDRQTCARFVTLQECPHVARYPRNAEES